MRRALALLLVIAMVILGVPLVSQAAGQANGNIYGTAKDSRNNPLSGYTVQLRNLDTGQLVATGKTGAAGGFEFTGLNAGRYVVEVVDAAGKIVGTSAQLTLTAGAMTISGLVITSPALGVLGAGAAGGGSFFATKAGIIVLAAAGAGAAGITYAAVHSPSK